MESRNFSEVLRDAQAGKPDAIEAILSRFLPLINKHSTIDRKLDEDMRQYIIIQVILQIPGFGKVIAK